MCTAGSHVYRNMLTCLHEAGLSALTHYTRLEASVLSRHFPQHLKSCSDLLRPWINKLKQARLNLPVHTRSALVSLRGFGVVSGVMQCLHLSNSCLPSPRRTCKPVKLSHCKVCLPGRRVVTRAANEPDSQPEASTSGRSTTQNKPQSKNVKKEVAQFATTFAPRASGPTGKNPAFKGSTLYKVFEAQAWLGLVVGGFLSFNLLFPSERPDIARLMGMWSTWMFTIPSLRARECNPQEKDALNLLFILVPLINVTLPFIWKSFPIIYSADCVALAGIFVWKGVWKLPQSTQSS